MAERRALIEGLSEIQKIDPDLAEEFIYDEKPRKTPRKSPPVTEAAEHVIEEPVVQAPLPPAIVAAAQVSTPSVSTSSPLTGVGRVPVGARVRTELAAALKRASLERQLQGIQPNSVQDILEESLELWLHKHGLLR